MGQCSNKELKIISTYSLTYYFLLTVQIIFYFAISTQANAGTDQWTHLELTGGSVRTIVVDPNTPAVVYVGLGDKSGGHVYRSSDSGKNWTAKETGLSGEEIDQLVMSPADSKVLYAVMSAAIYQTTDSGDNWNAIDTSDITGGIKALDIDPSDVKVMYAATDKGVFKTTDGGVSWTLKSTGLNSTLQLDTSIITIDPGDSQTIYIGTSSGVFKSTNGADNWTSSSTGLNASIINCITVDPGNSTKLFAGAFSGGTGPSIFVSTDSGQSWSSAGLDGLIVNSILVDPANSDVVYAGTRATAGSGIYKSIDGGSTWNDAGLNTEAIYDIVPNPDNTAEIYAAAIGTGLYKTTDSAVTWETANTGIYHTLANVVMVAPNDSTLLFAGTGGGLFRSTDTGTTWTKLGTADGLAGDVIDALIDPNNLTTIYATTFSDKVFKSTDSGDSWTEKSNGLPSNAANAMAIDPTDPNTLYLANYAGVYKTTNAGDQWLAKNTGLTNTIVLGIAVDKVNPLVVYAATQGGVFISTDAAESWSPTALNISTHTVALHPTLTSIVYADSRRSLNQGKNWSSTALSNVGLSIAIDPSNPTVIYTGGFGGISRSMDGGNSAAALNSGLDYLEIRSISVDPNTYTRVYAASPGGGVYQIDQTDLDPKPFVISLAVSPLNATINEGETQQFTATGTSSDQQSLDLTTQVTWSSSNPAVVSIDASSGLASAQGPGTVQITASMTGLQASTNLTVAQPSNSTGGGSGTNNNSSGGGGGGGSLYFLVTALLFFYMRRAARYIAGNRFSTSRLEKSAASALTHS